LAPEISARRRLPWDVVAELNLRTIPESQVFLTGALTGFFAYMRADERQANINRRLALFNFVVSMGLWQPGQTGI